ncbi:MAG: lytic transglycosylase domain-containing protein, partial [Flavobacteriaceae bacterium]|nr:lytic transglycosylase domain-containing protein [Flavobacteriaceae bacterium]
MKLLITLLNILAFLSVGFTQGPEVPANLSFADITLKITEGARELIQKDVDLLTRSPTYHQIKVERAKTYFPIIERIFEEEGIPLDFKYLVIQESALISDAVSSSNAVGFWQLKDYTALELGLRVDKEVDERMNIVSSTRAAARYFNKANALFDNWLHSLQSYQMGIGGAQRDLGDKFSGAKEMSITKNTYWYVRKYIAHKIAFEAYTHGNPEFEVTEYLFGANKSFDEIARETGIENTAIEDLNKWLKKGNVPSGKAYTVLLPGGYKAPQEKFVSTKVASIDPFADDMKENKIEKVSYEDFSDNFPV